MTDKDIAQFKAVLSDMQAELIAFGKGTDQSAKTVNLDQSSVGRLSRMDAMQSQAIALEGKRRREVQLTRIEAALDRIEDGAFGYCAACEDEIHPGRLKVDPANPFCVECAAKLS